METKTQRIKEIIGIQDRLIKETEKALHDEINMRLQPIKTFINNNEKHIEEVEHKDMITILAKIENLLFVNLQNKWAQEGIDNLIEHQRKENVKCAERMAERLRGVDEHNEDDDDDDDDDEEDDEEDIVVKRHKKKKTSRKMSYTYKRTLKRI